MSAAVARTRHSGNHRGRPWGHEGEHNRTITLAPAGPGRGIEADHAGNGYAVSSDDEAARRVCLRPSKDNGGMGGSSHVHPDGGEHTGVPEDGNHQAGSAHSGSHRRVVHDGHASQWKQPYRDSKDRSRRQSSPRDNRREEQYRPHRGGESRSPPRMGHGYGASRDEGPACNGRDRWDTEKRGNNRPCTRSRRRDSRNSNRGGGTEAHGRPRDGAPRGNSSSRRERSRHREGSRSRREERQHERQSPAAGSGEQQQPRKRGLDAEDASRSRHEEAEPQAKRHRSDNAGHHAQERRSHEERREERREDRQSYHRGQERGRNDRRYDERRHGHDEGWRRRAEEPSSRTGYESERHRERHRHGGEGRYSDRWGRRREEGWAPRDAERSACTRRSSSERHRRGEDLTAHQSAEEQQSQHCEDDGYQDVEEVPDVLAQPVEPLPAHVAACDQTIGAADDDGQDDAVDDPAGLFTNQPLDLPESGGTAAGYGRRSETGHGRSYGLFKASRESEERSSTHPHRGASYEEENVLATSSDEEEDEEEDEEPPASTTAVDGLPTDSQLMDEDGRDHQNIRVHAVHRSAEAKVFSEVARPAEGHTNGGLRSEPPAKQAKPLVHLPPQDQPGMMPQESQEARKGSPPQQPAQPSISGSSSGSTGCSSHSSHSSSGSSETCSDAGSFSEGGSTSSSSSSSTGSAAPRRRHHRHHHGSHHHHGHGRGLSPPPGCFQARQQALQQGHPVQQAPPPGAPPAPGPVDYRPPPPGMPMHRPPMPGYGYPPQMAPGMHFHRPPPFVPPGYPVPVYPMMHGMPPHPDVLGYGQLPPSDDFDDEPKGKGKGRGRRKRRKGSRTPRRRRGKIGEPPEKVGDDGDWELSKEDNGLKLIGEMAPPGVNWEYKVEDESRRCFAGFLECPVPHYHLPIFFEKIRNGTNWSQPMGPLGVIPRKTAWMVKPGCTCTYRYGGVEVLPQVFPDWMHELLTLYMPYCGLRDPSQWPNSCNVNLYENGSQSVGWHADDEALFQGLHNDIRIISLSLGQRRKFDLRKNWPEEEEKPVFRMMLGNGCLCTMEGMMQKHYQHRVPKESEDLGPRINLTWRWILKHSKACPLSSS